MDITASGDEQAFAENRFLSLGANNDKTLFIYQSEETEPDDGDPDTVEETELFINTLAVDNSQRISLFDHQIKVINLVDDYDYLDIYFVRSNETVSTAEHMVKSRKANPQTVTLENNSYDVSIIVNEDQSELLLGYDQLTLNGDSGDLYMVVEENDDSSSGYSVKFVNQRVD